MRFNRHFSVAALAGAIPVFIAGAAFAQALSPSEFAQKAAVSNEFEIRTSQLALQRAQSPAVKAFAQQMISDHTNAGQGLTAAVAANPQVKAPTVKLDAPHKALYNRLENAKGNFDQTYIQEQLDAHNEAVTLFQTYAQNGQAGPVKDFASATLPTLQMHLQHAQTLSGTAGGGTSATGGSATR